MNSLDSNIRTKFWLTCCRTLMILKVNESSAVSCEESPETVLTTGCLYITCSLFDWSGLNTNPPLPVSCIFKGHVHVTLEVCFVFSFHYWVSFITKCWFLLPAAEIWSFWSSLFQTRSVLWSLLFLSFKHILQEKLKTVQTSDRFSPVLRSCTWVKLLPQCRNTLLQV